MASRYISGLDEVGQSMRYLSEQVNTRISKRAVNKAAQPVKATIARKAPVAKQSYVHNGVTVSPGNIGRNVIVKSLSKSQTQLTAESIVTIRAKKKDAEARRVATFFEFGTVRMGAKPFFRSGFNESKNLAADVMAEELKSGITRALSK